MTRKTFNLAEGAYMAPLCTISEICPEGVLCNSFEKPEEFVFDWTENV